VEEIDTKSLFFILEMAINLRAMLKVTGLPANCDADMLKV